MTERGARQTAPPQFQSGGGPSRLLRRRGESNSFYDYDRIADELIPYVKDLGFTHVELMPHKRAPVLGLMGLSARGSVRAGPRVSAAPEEFAAFIDRFHEAGLGVLMDWVPAHFPSDPHGLARFDGTALYEHADPRMGDAS